MMDTMALGALAAQAMGEIAERYGDDASLRTAALVLEVDLGDSTDTLVASTEDRGWAQAAFLREAARTLELRLHRATTTEED